MRVLLAIAALALSSCRACPTDPKAGRCRQIDSELVGCIASLPPGAVIQCKECVDRAQAEQLEAGITSNDCGQDLFEHERSCF